MAAEEDAFREAYRDCLKNCFDAANENALAQTVADAEPVDVEAGFCRCCGRCRQTLAMAMGVAKET